MPNLVGSEESPHLLLLWKAPKEPPPCCVTKVNLEVWRPMGLLAVKTQISISSFFHWDYIIMMLVHTTNRLIKKEPWIENIFAFHLKICYRTIYKYDVIWLFVYTTEWLSGGQKSIILSICSNFSAPIARSTILKRFKRFKRDKTLIIQAYRLRDVGAYLAL